jgi:Ricin-type beta-trefoil lectin domain
MRFRLLVILGAVLTATMSLTPSIASASAPSHPAWQSALPLHAWHPGMPLQGAETPGLSAVKPDSEDGGFNNAVDPYECLGSSGGQNDADAVVWRCKLSNDQEWSYAGLTTAYYNGLYYYEWVNNNNDCLAVADASSAEGAHVVAWKCGATYDQWWSYDTNINCDGFHPLVNLGAALAGDFYVAGVSGGDPYVENGTDVVLWNFQNLQCNNQYWG